MTKIWNNYLWYVSENMDPYIFIFLGERYFSGEKKQTRNKIPVWKILISLVGSWTNASRTLERLPFFGLSHFIHSLYIYIFIQIGIPVYKHDLVVTLSLTWKLNISTVRIFSRFTRQNSHTCPTFLVLWIWIGEKKKRAILYHNNTI